MTLTTRVSAFFLGWLGLALAGFAVAVYQVQRANLYRQADDRLSATLDAVVAATESDEQGVEWEPHERTLPRGGGVVWLVVDPSGRIIDRSGPVASDGFANLTTAADESAWRVDRRRVDGRQAADRPPNNRVMTQAPLVVRKYHYLEFVAAVALGPIHDELNRLARSLAALAGGLWLVAVVVGRWLCRRTLAPVSEMAAAARTISPADPGERLHVHPTGDELEDLGRSLNGALARLEEAFDRQARFTGDAAHQLRTPLAAMLGQVEVALRRDRDPADYRDTLRAVADQARHLHRLTEGLLFLARADAEAGLPGLADVRLPEWLTDYLEAWRSAHPNVRVELTVDDQPASIRAHPELLAQLLDNLLDNAVKYGPAGGPVQVHVSTTDRGVDLIVADAGPGIAADDLPRVFEPFFRSPAAREAGIRGVGLGLSVARRIAEATGATLTAESAQGRGSRFVLRMGSSVGQDSDPVRTRLESCPTRRPWRQDSDPVGPIAQDQNPVPTEPGESA
jgi:heavy metal sensor kinase